MAKNSFTIIIFCILLSVRCAFAQPNESSNASNTANLTVKIVSTKNGMNVFRSMECGKLLVNCWIQLSWAFETDGYVRIRNNSSFIANDVLPRLPEGSTIGLDPSTPKSIPPNSTLVFKFIHSDPHALFPQTAIPIYGTNTSTVFVDVSQLN